MLQIFVTVQDSILILLIIVYPGYFHFELLVSDTYSARVKALTVVASIMWLVSALTGTCLLCYFFLQQFIDQDVGDFLPVPRQNKEDGIASARNSFQHCDFDLKTEKGLDHLASYKRTYDEVKKTFSTTPVHDEHSHPADAFIVLGQTWRQAKIAYPEPSDYEKLMAGNITNIKFGQMKKQHFEKMRREREWT